MPAHLVVIAILILSFLAPAWLEAGEQLFIDETKILSKLEQQGFAFNDILLNNCSENQSTQALARSPQYKNLSERLALDFEIQRNVLLETIPPHLHDRIDIFPQRWLTSPLTRFELVGLTLRPDRIIESPATCGEFRLIYRLRYNTEMNSRVPMTLMLEYYLPRSDGESCGPVWTQYTELFAGLKSQKSLPENAFFPTLTDFDHLKVNIQTSHIPRFRKQNKIMQGQYILRSFKRLPNGYFEPEALENSIDFAAVNADADLKQELLNWLLEPDNMKKIDNGSYLIPEKFLSKKALSVVPFGLQRIANQSLSRVFSETDFAEVDFGPYKQIKSPYSFLRRLDSLSCQGCHVSRSVAGFHFMGGSETYGFNTIFTPYSNHFSEVQEWRESFLKNPEHTNMEFEVPAPERSHRQPGTAGQHCGVKDVPGFAHWSCVQGFACYPSFPAEKIDRIGICLPEVLQATSGQVCDAAKFVSTGDPVFDELTENYIVSCGPKGVCAQSQHGFPNGKCTHSCKNAAEHPEAICVPTPKLTHFSPCLAIGKSFKTCIEETSAPVLVVACDRQKACGDDFVCAGVAGQTQGVCLPSYTQPQLLIKPHPSL